MIACGVFIVIVGFIGCWAAVKEHGWALRLVRLIYMTMLLTSYKHLCNLLVIFCKNKLCT